MSFAMSPRPRLLRPLGPEGRRLRRHRLEPRLVRVVAVRAEQVLLVPVPLAHAPAVHAGPPVAVLLPVALAAEAVRLLERNGIAARQVQAIAVVGVVAVEAPAV